MFVFRNTVEGGDGAYALRPWLCPVCLMGISSAGGEVERMTSWCPDFRSTPRGHGVLATWSSIGVLGGWNLYGRPGPLAGQWPLIMRHFCERVHPCTGSEANFSRVSSARDAVPLRGPLCFQSCFDCRSRKTHTLQACSHMPAAVVPGSRRRFMTAHDGSSRRWCVMISCGAGVRRLRRCATVCHSCVTTVCDDRVRRRCAAAGLPSNGVYGWWATFNSDGVRCPRTPAIGVRGRRAMTLGDYGRRRWSTTIGVRRLRSNTFCDDC